VDHPIVVRAAVDYKYGDITTRLFPAGNIHTAVTSVEGLFYRGTDKLTGYMGAGIVYSYNYFKLTSTAADSLLVNHAISDVRIKNTFGYRITLGMRIHRSYAIEFAITEVRPDFVYTSRMSPSQYSEVAERTRLNDVRLSFGFLLPVRVF
jgi:outer membrane protein W